MGIITFYETEEDKERGDYVAESSMVQYHYSRPHKRIVYKRNIYGSAIYVENYKRAEVYHSETGFVHIKVVIGGEYHEKD